LPSFRQKIRGLDVLLVDDVQFFAGKRATVEELLYTIDALQGRGGQVVLVSDRPASELSSISPDLSNRISAGLSVALDPPDYETRKGIVRAMAERMQIPLDQNVVDAIAQQVVGSGRLLSGAINRLVATSMAIGKPITLELAEPALIEFSRQHAPQVKLIDIQRAVCEVFGVESSSLKSQRKTRAIAEPRMLAMWLARQYTRAALSEIGDFFGRRSHSTVVSAQKKFDKLISAHGELVVCDQSCPVEEAIRRIEAKLRTA
jgi:chromosomal replication initiator protein